MARHQAEQALLAQKPPFPEMAFPVKMRNFVRWGHTYALDETSTLINLCF
jgi:hypothetical protein